MISTMNQSPRGFVTISSSVLRYGGDNFACASTFIAQSQIVRPAQTEQFEFRKAHRMLRLWIHAIRQEGSRVAISRINR